MQCCALNVQSYLLGTRVHSDSCISCFVQIPGSKAWKITTESPPKALANKALHGCILNHLLVNPLFAFFLYPIAKRCGVRVSGPLPAIGVIIKQLLVCLLSEDFLFYWQHRLLHHRLIYKYVHKRHHEFKQNVGIAVSVHSATVPCYSADFVNIKNIVAGRILSPR